MIFPFPQENLKLARATNTCNEPRSPSKSLFNRGQNQGGSAAVLKIDSFDNRLTWHKQKTFSKKLGRTNRILSKLRYYAPTKGLT